MSIYSVFLEVYINGERVESQSELTCVVGKSLLLGMRVHNSLSWSLIDLELSTQFFQDHQNGIINYQLDTRIATAGATQIQLPQVKMYYLILFFEHRVIKNTID